jgi:hypothetical protein
MNPTRPIRPTSPANPANPASRPTTRAAATAIAVSALLGATAAPAYAKTSIAVSAVSISALVVVTGQGADDAAGFQHICVAEAARSGPWQLIACSPVGYDYARTISAAVPLDQVAPQRFRAELFRVGSPSGANPVLITVSPTRTVGD